MSSGKQTLRKTSARRGVEARGAPLTRRERVESKETAIVAAAYDMIVEQGFAKATIAEIAKASGVAEGTVYLYFNNKEALGRAVLAVFYEQLTEAARKGVERLPSTRERLEFLARHHLTNIIKVRRLLEMLLILDRNLESYEGSQIYKMNRTYVAVFDAVVRDGVWRGDIDEKITPWVLRDLFYGGLDYSMRTILLKHRKNAIDDVVAGIVALIVREPDTPGAKRKGADVENTAARLERVTKKLEKIVKNATREN